MDFVLQDFLPVDRQFECLVTLDCTPPRLSERIEESLSIIAGYWYYLHITRLFNCFVYSSTSLSGLWRGLRTMSNLITLHHRTWAQASAAVFGFIPRFLLNLCTGLDISSRRTLTRYNLSDEKF